ncbi:MAG: type II secretion system protein, partial [Rhodospirillaceae bacterium]
MTLRKKLARGFTLIEIAIVMVVIGLVLSGGLMAVAPVLQSSKFSDTNAKLDRIEQALTLYVIRYGCLPCPAAANEPAAATYTPGQAVAGSAAYRSGCGTTCNFPVAGAAGTEGAVPWVNLGLSEGDVADGWGMRIGYSVSAGLEVANSMVRTPPATYPAGGITVNNLAAVEQTGGAGNRAAYVLLSHGPNLCRGYYSGGLRNQPN